MTNNRTGYGLLSMDGRLLYQENHSSFGEALSQAILDQIDLTGLDARAQDLRSANLDGGNFIKADFSGSNLSEANMSEANFNECVFDAASLFDTCFCYSNFNACYFIDSRFGMTDFSQAEFSNCTFSGYSFLTANFFRDALLYRNIFLHENTAIAMSAAPLVVSGLKNIMAIFDDKILIGSDLFDFEREQLKNHINNSRIG